ncbi:PRTRC system ThiF family protein [Alistipes indistinctus]|uniref:THIF-type NAD/FAD binding fold domain-containing protein n=1 Tax=Alistipes indistinctus YIT 12060 TaxID=742725 RepID=G5HBF6_9BACT|nr:PRTRC system ThiF family protein [Alistipes indistinctus]EHB91922.1 hypothetical protein HMPREF9450_01971 [Alistipes indistinctus YIT 12060]UWN59635.1 PRTRC system ThiF family protein [Alistipes indistinctus YIT 12060]
MTRAHFSDSYLLNPQHPVTINVIGAGGTGSQVVTSLARMDQALRTLGHCGLSVRVYDPDLVSESNIGRQLFGEADLGLNKAQCIITRINRFFGSDWQAETTHYPQEEDNTSANLFITCTDSVSSRVNLARLLKSTGRGNSYTDYATPLYWCDFGNAQKTGQIILGTIRENIEQPKSKKFQTIQRLPCVTDYVKSYGTIKDEDSGPSCSLAEALNKQDLFVNSTLAHLGCSLLWKLFREGLILYHGLYLNLDTLRVNPISV